MWYFLFMQIVNKKDPISSSELAKMSEKMFGNLVKAVVDIKKEIMAIDAEMHSDEEVVLLENGSNQDDLWGINLYPEFCGSDDFIEFDSMINLRPSQQNRSRDVEDEDIRKRIIVIVKKLTKK